MSLWRFDGCVRDWLFQGMTGWLHQRVREIKLIGHVSCLIGRHVGCMYSRECLFMEEHRWCMLNMDALMIGPLLAAKKIGWLLHHFWTGQDRTMAVVIDALWATHDTKTKNNQQMYGWMMDEWYCWIQMVLLTIVA